MSSKVCIYQLSHKKYCFSKTESFWGVRTKVHFKNMLNLASKWCHKNVKIATTIAAWLLLEPKGPKQVAEKTLVIPTDFYVILFC